MFPSAWNTPDTWWTIHEPADERKDKNPYGSPAATESRKTCVLNMSKQKSLPASVAPSAKDLRLKKKVQFCTQQTTTRVHLLENVAVSTEEPFAEWKSFRRASLTKCQDENLDEVDVEDRYSDQGSSGSGATSEALTPENELKEKKLIDASPGSMRPAPAGEPFVRSTTVSSFRKTLPHNSRLERQNSKDSVKTTKQPQRRRITIGETLPKDQERLFDFQDVFNAPRTVASRRPSVAERLLYNTRSYAVLPPAYVSNLKFILEQFKLLWGPPLPLSYSVQDHSAACVCLVPTAISGEHTQYAEKLKCRCPLERTVSFCTLPFRFHLSTRPFGHVTKAQRPCSDTIETDGGCVPHESLVERPYTAVDGALQQTRAATSSVKPRCCDVLQYSGSHCETPHNVDVHAVNSLENGARSFNSEISERSPTDFDRCVPENSGYQLVRNVWFCREPWAAEKLDHLDVVLLFGGKDMLALDWLNFVDCWYHDALCNVVRRQFLYEAGKTNGLRRTPSNVAYFSAEDLTARRRSSLRSRRNQSVGSCSSQKHEAHHYSRSASTRVSNEMMKRTGTAQPSATMQLLDRSSSHYVNPGSSVNPARLSHVLSDRRRLAEKNQSSSLAKEYHQLGCTTVAFGLVEYPGYGCSKGLPSPTSCVESGIELLCSAVIQLQPSTVYVHIIGYSLGSALALRAANVVGNWLERNNQTARSSKPTNTADSAEDNEYLSEKLFTLPPPEKRVMGLKNVLLIAPFTTTSDCVQEVLSVPKALQPISGLFLDHVMDGVCQLDNYDALTQFANLVCNAPELFRGISVTFLYGDCDSIVPLEMGSLLSSHFRRSLTPFVLENGIISFRCIRVPKADHKTLLRSSRLVKVLRKHHPSLCFLSKP